MRLLGFIFPAIMLMPGTDLIWSGRRRAGVSAALHHYHTGIVGEVELTPEAASSDFIVVATTGVGKAWDGFCDSSAMDWRGWMPIYLARAIGPTRPLLITDVKPLNGRPGNCRLCYSGSWEEQNTFFDCVSWLKSRGAKETHFVIVAGTGDTAGHRGSPKDYPDVLDAINRPWVDKKKTTVWHFPISRREEIDHNQVFPSVFRNFQVMRDGDWVKPVQREGLSEWIDWCRQQPKKNDLLYIARFHGWKGQLDFMNNADPKLLKGFTVHFYSSVNGRKSPDSIPSLIEKTADKRGINVVVHWKKQPQKKVAYHSCFAKGLVHFARVDANPRVVDESIINGLQTFVSRQSHLPTSLRSQPFVKMTSNSDSDRQNRLNHDLAEFMARLDSKENADKLYHFAKERLDPPKAYHKLCRDIGICAKQ
jgi:hypothetical protein